MSLSCRRQTGVPFASRSDVILINIAGKPLTSDRLKWLISTGGQTEAVRPGYGVKPGLTVLGLIAGCLQPDHLLLMILINFTIGLNTT